MPVGGPSLWRNVGAAIVGAVLLAGCQESQIPKQLKPVPTELSDAMKKKDMSETAPIFIRIFKQSSELEIWKQKRDGKYALLETYHVCKWSGELGPKFKEGDRQAPEGFYTVTPAQMNPKSQYYLSFNIGYPNTFDRAHGRTGSHLMVHGGCSSAGCYSMTDESAGELFALARDSFRGGQRAFQIQAFPFRMTPENMAKNRDSKHFEFWKMLKTGSDHFELTKIPPKVDVCGKSYVFNADSKGRRFKPTAACPAYEVPESLKVAVAAKQAEDEAKMTAAVTQIAQEAQQEAEKQRMAEEKRVAAEAKAAQKAAAKEARSKQVSERLGVFGRLFGRESKSQEPATVAASPPPAAESANAPVTAFAPAATPVPPTRPAAERAAAPATTAAVEPPAPASPPPAPASAPPTASAVPAPVAEAQPAITPEMTPAIPSAGRFVKKQFLWVGDGDG